MAGNVANTPVRVLRKVSSFTLGDRLKNVIRPKHVVSDIEPLMAGADVGGCQRCLQVWLIISSSEVVLVGLVSLSVTLQCKLMTRETTATLSIHESLQALHFYLLFHSQIIARLNEFSVSYPHRDGQAELEDYLI